MTTGRALRRTSSLCLITGTRTVTDLVTMVNIALGSAPVATCLAGDVNGDSHVTVNEVITAVNKALDGCPTLPGL